LGLGFSGYFQEKSMRDAANAAEEIFLRQAYYDRLHHLNRLVWLGGVHPKWGCGTPVSGYDIKMLTEQSERALKEPTTAYHSCDTSNPATLSELDAFAAASGHQPERK
jgi:hypothetical protein